jgi:phosphate acetyltransferase
MELIENLTFDEIAIGAAASSTRALLRHDLELAAALSGEADLLALDGIVGHLLCGALVEGLIGSRLPGPGTLLLEQDWRFLLAVAEGDRITAHVVVTEKRAAGSVIGLDCRCTNQRGETVLAGRASVQAPAAKLHRRRGEPSEIHIASHRRYQALIDACASLPPLAMAVAHPCDRESLLGAVEAAKAGLIQPILVAPEAKLREVAAKHGIDIQGLRLVAAAHSHDAAAKAVALARSGEVQALMKGSLHTDELMHEVALAETGLRTARRISHVFVMDVPTYPRALFITDAAINIYPTLDDKKDICQNAIELAHALGIAEPKVAILSAVETVHPKIQSTLDAAALCKMADRGQITGGLLDGPLAFDNAVSEVAARTKNIVSPVAGRADILLVPDLEAGNMLAKQLSYLANAEGAGIVVGARVPIVLTSRADDTRTRLASCAVAVLLARMRATKPAVG